MGFGLLIAGLFFIFNPYVNIIDILPDIVGYLLIFAGTAKLAMLSADVMTSRRFFNAMLWISAGRAAATLLILRFNDGFLTLTITVIIAVADSIYAIRAFSLLFSALDTMSCMAGGMKTASDAVRQFTPVAIILKNGLSLIPEFTELSTGDGFGNAGLVSYKSMLMLVCVTAGLAIGAAWLVMTVRYFSALSRDKTFITVLETRYRREVAENAALLTRLDLISFIKFLPIPLIFLLQINFDGFYIMPEFLCPVILIILLLRIKKYANVTPSVYTAGAAGAILLLKYIMELIYSGKFGSYAYPYDVEGFLLPYLSYVVPAAVGYALLAAAYIKTIGVISDIARLHTGEAPRGDERTDALNSRVAGELIKRYRFICVWTVVLCVVLTLSSAAAAFFNMGYFIAIVIDAAVIVITYSFCSELSAQVSRRYT